MALSNLGMIVDFAGRPLADPLERMARALSLQGATVSTSAELPRGRAATVAVAHSSVYTLPEDDGSPDRAQHRVVVLADARLDNRDELLPQLPLPSSAADEAVVHASYEKWRSESARRFRGDFAFVAWDPGQETLVAHRDVFGVRALLWAFEDNRLVVASTLAGVRAALTRPPTHNRHYLEGWINRTHRGLTRETAFNEIFWLPPGHQLSVHQGRAIVTAYDAVTAARERPHNEADAFRQFRHLLTTAVEVRLRSRTPIGFRVSGGFDSSAILCLADLAAKDGRCSAPLRSYSATFARNAKADERTYLQAVLDRCTRVTATQLPWDDRLWTVDLIGNDADGFPLEEPPDSSRFAAVPQSQLAVADGCRVIHEGTWADQLLLRWPYGNPSLWWDLPAAQAARECGRFLATGGHRFVRSMPLGLLHVIRRIRAAAALGHAPETALSAQLRRQFRFGNNGMVMNAKDRRARFLGAEFRYPYLDRTLHEFVMSLPPHYLFGRGQIKRLQRESLADVLPEAFRTRDTFGAMTHLLVEGAIRDRDKILQMLRASLVVQSGLVTPQRIQTLVDQIGPGMKPWVTVDIQRVLSVEVWLKNEAQGSRPHTGT